jgi:hypothetical protein
MTQNAFLAYLRRYAAFALRSRNSYADSIQAFVVPRWLTVSDGVTDPAERAKLAQGLADMVERNYSMSDPFFVPTADEVLKWIERAG